MPITIQEIIASDTISQLVDKTNFNFDQLMLNGGGPAGPIGPAGPVGPPGGRGPKGTTWYTGTVDPNTIIVSANLLVGDFYLEDSGIVPAPVTDGDVWEYNGTVWVLTTTNLEGPTGPPGQTGGFSQYFGIIAGPPNASKNTVYPNPQGSAGTGATAFNEGIQSVMIGGGIGLTDTTDSGFALTSEYLIDNFLAQSIQSPNTVLFLHQKNSQSRAIVLHGGQDATNSEKYEQTSLGLLSAISLQPDDMVRVDVPKGASSPTSNPSNVGFQVYSPLRGHDYFAGGQIKMSSGMAGAAPGGAWYNANLELLVGTGGNATGNKFSVVTQGSAAIGFMELGNNVTTTNTPPSTAAAAGTFQLTGGNMQMTTNLSSSIKLIAGNTIKLDTKTGLQAGSQIQIFSGDGGIDIRSDGGGINIIQDDNTSLADIQIRNDYTGSGVGGDIYIINRSQIILRRDQSVASEDPSIVIDNEGATSSRHTRFVGRSTWASIDPLAGTGVLPLGDIQRFFYGSMTENTLPNAVMNQYGNGADNIAWQAGAMYSKYQLSEGSVDTGEKPISLNIGKDENIGTLGIATETVGDSNPGYNTHQYQHIHADCLNHESPPAWPYRYGETMSAVPFVYNRSFIKGKNAPSGNIPSYYMNDTDQQQTAVYGWSLDYNGSMSPSIVGMQAVNHPFIEFIAAAELNGPAPSQLLTNTNFYFNLEWPIVPDNVANGGQVPGSDYRISVTNINSSWTEATHGGGAANRDYYGTINVKIPMTRFSQNGGASWGPWNWYNIPVTTTAGFPGGNTQHISHLSATLTYNGSMTQFTTSRTNWQSPSGECVVMMQKGYEIMSEKIVEYNYGNNFCNIPTCFTAGTQVIMSDGTSQNIEDVNIGDQLLAFGGINTVMDYDRPILGGRMLYSFNGGRSFVTAEHPFMTTDGWKSIDPNKLIEENAELAESLNVTLLKVGDKILTKDELVTIEAIDENPHGDPIQTLYNFRLDGDQTYYADGYLTHNK